MGRGGGGGAMYKMGKSHVQTFLRPPLLKGGTFCAPGGGGGGTKDVQSSLLNPLRWSTRNNFFIEWPQYALTND